MRVLFAFFALFVLFSRGFCADRVVSLSPALTEILVYVGAGDRVVGVTVFTRLLPEVERVGGIVNPNVEKIIALRPDLVVATTMTSERVLSILKRYTKVKIFRLVTVEDIEKAIEELADATVGNGREKRKRFLFEFRKSMKGLSCLKGKTITVLVSHPPPVVAGESSYIGEALKKLGANVIPSGTFSPVSTEFLFKEQPEILIFPCGTEIPSLLRSARRVCLNGNRLLHPSPEFLKALEELGREVCGY